MIEKWDEEMNEIIKQCFEINNKVEKAKYLLINKKNIEVNNLTLDPNYLIKKQYVSKVRKELIEKFPILARYKK